MCQCKHAAGTSHISRVVSSTFSSRLRAPWCVVSHLVYICFFRNQSTVTERQRERERKKCVGRFRTMPGDSPPALQTEYTEDQLVALLSEAVQDVEANQADGEGQSLTLPSSVTFILSTPSESDSSNSDSGFAPSTLGSRSSRTRRRFLPSPTAPITFSIVDTSSLRRGSSCSSPSSPSGSCSSPGGTNTPRARRNVEDTPSLSYLALESTLDKEGVPSRNRQGDKSGKLVY